MKRKMFLIALVFLLTLTPMTFACHEPEPGTKPDLTPRTTPTRTIISRDSNEYMLMPYLTANPSVGFHIYEAGAYTILAFQNGTLVWTSPLQLIWHSQGVNLIYYVGFPR